MILLEEAMVNVAAGPQRYEDGRKKLSWRSCVVLARSNSYAVILNSHFSSELAAFHATSAQEAQDSCTCKWDRGAHGRIPNATILRISSF
jgi:hypothetical protein